MTVNHDQLAHFLTVVTLSYLRRSPSSRDATEINVRRVVHGFILGSAARAEALGLGLFKTGGCP